MSESMANEVKNSFQLLKIIEKLLGKLSLLQYEKLLQGKAEICYRDDEGEVGLKDSTRKKTAAKKVYDEAELLAYVATIKAMSDVAELKKFVAKQKFDKKILLAIAEKCGIKCQAKDTKDAIIGRLHYDLVGFSKEWNSVKDGVRS